MKKLILCVSAAFISMTNVSFAQIPNNGFENWTSVGGTYANPTSWDQLNAMTSNMSTYTCTKGTPGNPGAGYLKLVSKNVSMMGIMPGLAVSGLLSTATYQPISGFAFSQRPQNLTGNWQYMTYGNDTGYIAVYLTQWNTSMNMRDTVAMAMQTQSGMVMSWASFSIPLMYMSGATPDSAMIILSSSGTTPVANSYLYIDNLAFAGSVASIAENKNAITDFSFYPNPSTETVKLNYTLKSTNNVSIKITDLIGKTVKELKPISTTIGKNMEDININGLGKGVYMITIQSNGSLSTKKLIIE